MDLLNVLDEAKAIIDHVRTHQEPYFVEAIVYRFVGHGAADITDPWLVPHARRGRRVAQTRPAHEPAAVPVSAQLGDGGGLETLDEQAREQVADAARFADESPDPDPSELYMHVLAD
jgi:pyruvate dehydrogenase E1 component alpha subunit